MSVLGDAIQKKRTIEHYNRFIEIFAPNNDNRNKGSSKVIVYAIIMVLLSGTILFIVSSLNNMPPYRSYRGDVYENNDKREIGGELYIEFYNDNTANVRYYVYGNSEEYRCKMNVKFDDGQYILRWKEWEKSPAGAAKPRLSGSVDEDMFIGKMWFGNSNETFLFVTEGVDR